MIVFQNLLMETLRIELANQSVRFANKKLSFEYKYIYNIFCK